MILLAGCVPKTPVIPHLQNDMTPFLKQLPSPLNASNRHRLYTDMLEHRYRPWQLEALDATREAATWAERYYATKTLYGENRRPLQKSRFERWIHISAFENYNTLKRHALTVHPTSLRLFPTSRPIFYNPSLEGEGYPFDYAQNSALKAFTPLIVSHLSRDGGWAFVQSPFALGWVPIRDIAFVTPEQIDTLMALPLIVVLQEGTPIYDGREHYLFSAKMATLLPCTGEEEGLYKIVVPKRRNERLVADRSLIPKEAAAPMPLTMDDANVRRVASELLGEPYGWGGMAEDRDCSAMTRDFFAPFGIWLPRNSKAQARMGKVFDLHRMKPEEKERFIIDNGIPFRTLIYLPGHIMLYVGQKDGHAWAMHNMWGIHTKGNGRYIVGEAVISDLWLGKDLPQAERASLFIERIESINFPAE